MGKRMRVLVRGFGLASEHHCHATLRIESHDCVGALVRGPDIPVAIDFDVVRKPPGIQILADLSQVLSVLIELKKLRGAGAVSRPVVVASVKNKDVTLCVYR